MFPAAQAALRILLAALVLLSALCGCLRTPTPVELEFAVRYGNEPISCTQPASGLQLVDLRFYVHDIGMIDAAGKTAPLRLIADGRWQDERTVLLDLEDGQGGCINGSAEQNTVVRGTVGAGPITGVVFTVGVPASLNHRDPLRARAPLNDFAMHWHWLSGYKFMRAGVGNASDGFWLHLGSSRCDGSISDGIECRAGNRVFVELKDFNPQRDRIVLDLGQLLAGVDLADGVPGDCSSGPGEPGCTAPFQALGLAFGEASRSQDQQVFRGEKSE